MPARQAAAFGAALLAGAAWVGWGRLAILASAVLLGLARAPGPLHPPDVRPARPVALEGRVAASWTLPECGWEGRLEELRDPQGRRLDRPERSLRFRGLPPSAPPPPGSRVRIEGLLQGTARGLLLLRAGWRRLEEPAKPGSVLEALRNAVRARLRAVLPPAEAGLARALLLGERGAVPGGRYAAWRRLGLLHLLAVSGLHVCLWDRLLRRGLPGRLARARLPLLFLAGLLAGGRAPVVRALSALFLRDLCAARGRRVSASSLVFAALFVELALLPPRETGPGLVLSYSATLALIAGRAPAASGAVRRSLQVSLAAFLGTAPWLQRLQGTVEPWSVPLTPVLALLLPFRLTAYFLVLLPGLAPLLAPLLDGLGRAEAGLLAQLDRLPGTPWSLTRLPALTLGCWALGGLALLWQHGPRRRAAGLLLALGAAGWMLAPEPRPGILALPAGHGLALVVAGRTRTLLFDFGSAEQPPAALVDRQLMPALARRRWAAPSFFVASHGDADHLRGLPLLRRRCSLVEWEAPPGGTRRIPGMEPFEVTLLGLPSALRDQPNAGGQALELRCAGRRAVLLGDPLGPALRDLVRRLAPGPVDLLLAPHHGRTTDGLPELLAHLRPREIWVSCGPADLPWAAGALLAASGARVRSTLAGTLERPGQPWAARPSSARRSGSRSLSTRSSGGS